MLVVAVDGDSRQQAKVLLVDDHEIVRSGLRAFIEMEGDFVVTGEAATADEAIRLVQSDRPDLVIMDVRLPDRSGISACHEIIRRFPNVKVLILTSYANNVTLSSAMTAGASGYLLKDVLMTDFVHDVRKAVEGESLFHREIDSDTAVEPDLRLAALSHQERVLANHLADGLTNRQIAAHMGLAEKTVKNYVSKVLTKLAMARRSEVAAFVVRVQSVSGRVTAEHTSTCEEAKRTDQGDEAPTSVIE